MKKATHIEITELFLVKADWNRTFTGKIVRETNEDGLSTVRGSVTVNEGKIWSTASNQDELGNYLDDICTMKLDKNLHASDGPKEMIAGISSYLN